MDFPQDHSIDKHQQEVKNVESSIMTLNANLEELNQRKADVLNKMQHLQDKINNEGANTKVQRLLSLSETLKEHTAKLREIIMLKRQVDDVPTQAELIQYERRFSELYVHIQGKLRQTRKYYATFNALLEIKELMLKETSLLNSISSQFQDAITSTPGRMKLIDSMEGILKGIQQKLERVQLELQAERKACDAVKEKYAAAVSEQRRCYSLLKVFQEECAKNERLQSQMSETSA